MKEINKVTVLLVENSEEFSNWIMVNLKKNSNLNVVGNIKTKLLAKKKIRDINPELIILDLELDDGSGFEIIKEIHNDNLPIKIIVFTNHSIYRNECISLGCKYFFDKSNEFEEMINSVNQLVENQNNFHKEIS